MAPQKYGSKDRCNKHTSSLKTQKEVKVFRLIQMPSFQFNAFRKWCCFPLLNMNVWGKTKYFWSSSFLSMKIFIFNSNLFLSCLQKTSSAEFSCSSLGSDCHYPNERSNSNLSGLTSNAFLILVALCKGLWWFLYKEILLVTGLGHLLLKKGHTPVFERSSQKEHFKEIKMDVGNCNQFWFSK